MNKATNIAIQLLAAGYTVESVADTLGSSEEDIRKVSSIYAQAILDTREALSAETGKQIVVAEEETLSIDEKLDSMENAIADKMIKLLPLQTDAMKLTKMLATVNGAKRRGKGEGYTGPVTVDNRQVVQLQLSERMSQQVRPVIETSSNNEVVSVNGKGMQIASSAHVNKLAGLGEPEEVLPNDSTEQ